MEYPRRMTRIILITLALSLFLSFAILYTKQFIQSTYSNNRKNLDNPLLLFDPSKGDKIGPLHLTKYKTKDDEPTVIDKNEDKIFGDRTQTVKKSTNLINWKIIVITLLCIGLLSIIFLRKKNIQNDNPFSKTSRSLNFSKLTKKSENFDVPINYPTGEIRKLLIEWEKQLPPIEQRKTYETIQLWFERIGKDNQFIPIYEKVRYGNHSLEKAELELVKQFLN